MDISCELLDGMVYIPTSYEMERGLYYKCLPITVVPAEQAEQLREALRVVLARGNPPITREEAAARSRSKDQPILAAAGVRSWREFERRQSGSWSLVVYPGIRKIEVYRPGPDVGWSVDKSKSITFPPEASLDDMIDCLITMVQEKIEQHRSR